MRWPYRLCVGVGLCAVMLCPIFEVGSASPHILPAQKKPPVDVGPCLSYTDVPLALFVRHGYVWIASPGPIQPKVSAGSWPEGFSKIETVPTLEGGSVVRLKVPPGVFPSVVRNGKTLQIFLSRDPQGSYDPISWERGQMVSGDAHQILLPLETAHAVRLMDPEKGTPLVIFPIAEAGRGVHTVVRRPDFVLHQTIQGGVVELGSSDVTVTLPQGGIPHITRRGGVRQSPKTDYRSAALTPPQIAGWLTPPPGLVQQTLENQMLKARTPLEKVRLRWQLAKLFLATHVDEETFAILDIMAHNNNRLSEYPATSALAGVCLLNRGHTARGLYALSQPGFETQLFKAEVKIKAGQIVEGMQDLDKNFDQITRLPPSFQARFLLLGARIAVTGSHASQARRFLDPLKKVPLSPLQKEDVARLWSQVNRFPPEKDPMTVEGIAISRPKSDLIPGAVPDFRYVTQPMPLQEDRAHAHARFENVLTLLREKKIGAQQAIPLLETFLLGQKGGVLEQGILEQLLALYGAENNVLNVLRMYARLISHAPLAEKPSWKQKAQQVFQKVLRDQKVSPLIRVAAFQTYPQWRPTQRSEARSLVTQMADVLAQMGLHKKAVRLLESWAQSDEHFPQDMRLTLAERYMSCAQPEKALETLDLKGDQVPLDRHLVAKWPLVASRILLALKQYDEALDRISGVPGPLVHKLRAEIYMAQKDWTRAVQAFEQVILRYPADKTIIDGLGVALLKTEKPQLLRDMLIRYRSLLTPFLKAVVLTDTTYATRDLQLLRDEVEALKKLGKHVNQMS